MMTETYKLITILKEQHGMTSTQVASLIGVSKSAITKWESGDMPSIDNLYKISKLFNVTVEELINGRLNEEDDGNYLENKYEAAKYDIRKLVNDREYSKIKSYYRTYQTIKDNYLRLLYKAAFDKLDEKENEELKYLLRYISPDTYGLNGREYDSYLSLDVLVKEVKTFYESISELPKSEKEWKIEQTYYFQNLVGINANQDSLEGRQVYMEYFRLLNQFQKSEVLCKLSDFETVKAIRNPLIYQMIDEGANVMKRDFVNATQFDEHIMESFDGKITEVEIKKMKSYRDSDLFSNSGYGSYQDYLDLIDYNRTKLLREASYLRHKSPKTYYLKLQNGEFDSLIDL